METLPTVHEIAKTIDHAILKPNISRSQVIEALRLAATYDVFSVCVRPTDVAFASAYLQGTDVKVGTVIGFPHGSTLTTVKSFETVKAIQDGAVEIDMVLNIGWLKSGLIKEVETDIRTVVAIAKENNVEMVKIILETAYLSDREIVKACKLAEFAGADFVKTSTGFAKEGATSHNLKLMLNSVSQHVQVKASGGVSNLDILLFFKKMGVTRFGTSATKIVLDDLQTRLTTGEKNNALYNEDY